MKTNHNQKTNLMETLARQPAVPRYFAIAAALIGVFLLAPQLAQAAAGDLDPRFGNGGVVTTDFSQTDDVAFGIAVQPDGKIVASGQSGIYPELHSALARYNRNGRLDSTFGTGGKVVVTFDSSSDYLYAPVIQSDGKIVAAGSAGGAAFLLARFNADGSTDFGFGSGGKQITDFFGAGAIANGIVLQSDGKFVVAGTASDSGTRPNATDIAVARYNVDGTLDATFGTGGETAIPFSASATEQGNALALAADGKIVVTGAAFKTFATPPDFALVRYNSDGSLDTGFGNGGAITTDIVGGTDVAQAIAIQADGRIVAAGRSFRSNFDLTLARYRNEGTPTTTDATPPTAPTNLTASFNSVTNAIDLSWTAATDNVAVTGYRIYRDGGPAPVATVNATTFSDAGVAGTHSYGVTAIDAVGNESGLSNIASATANAGDIVPPSAPTSLVATANLATGTIELSWTASTDDVGVTGYRVFRDNGTTPIATVSGTTFNDPNQLGTHVYAVAAIDAAGNQSPLSNSATATITIPEGSTLAGLTVDPATVTAPANSIGTVTLNGAAPAGGISVTLSRSDTGKATVPASVTVPEGTNSATFVISTLTGRLGGGKNPVTITATLGSSRVSATLNILRP